MKLLSIPRIGSSGRFALALASLVVALLLVAACWYGVPPKPRAVLWEAPGGEHRMMISADGQTLASRRHSGVTLWNLQTWDRRVVPESDTTGSPEILQLSFDGRTTVYRAGKEGMRWWNADTGADPIWLHDSYPAQVRGLTADGKILITQDESGFHLWNMQSASKRPLPANLGRLLREPQTLPDGRIVGIDELPPPASGLRIWDLRGGTLLKVIVRVKPDNEFQSAVAVSPRGDLLAAMDGTKGKLWDLATAREICLLHGETPGLTIYEFSADGRRLLFALDDDELRRELDLSPPLFVPRLYVWDLTAAPPRLLQRFDDVFGSFSQDGRWLLLDSSRLSERRTAVRDSASLCTVVDISETTGLRLFAPDGQTVALRRWDNNQIAGIFRFLGLKMPNDYCQIWNVADGRELFRVRGGESYTYFPDGKSIAIGKDDGTMEIWDIPPRRPVLIDYGLPLLFALLLLLGGWHIRSWRRRGSG